jgi:hypothetical protein
MTELRAPDCKVFVDAEMSERELLSLVAQVLFSPDAPVTLEATVIRNEEFDSNRRRLFPDGFVYFRYTLDLYRNDTALPDFAASVATLLDSLWDWDIPAIAACAFEDRLPEHGGYRSRAVPWPM